MRRLYAADPDKYRQNSRRWYQKNRAVAIYAAKLRRHMNPEYSREANRIRSKRNRQAPGCCTQKQWMFRVEYFGWRCVYCHKELNQYTLTIDHKIPLAGGGSHWPSNLVPSCKPCNSRKRDRRWFQ
jgi:5-methylcytosine-specific restriction endonuclease McrA